MPQSSRVADVVSYLAACQWEIFIPVSHCSHSLCIVRPSQQFDLPTPSNYESYSSHWEPNNHCDTPMSLSDPALVNMSTVFPFPQPFLLSCLPGPKLSPPPPQPVHIDSIDREQAVPYTSTQNPPVTSHCSVERCHSVDSML